MYDGNIGTHHQKYGYYCINDEVQPVSCRPRAGIGEQAISCHDSPRRNSFQVVKNLRSGRFVLGLLSLKVRVRAVSNRSIARSGSTGTYGDDDLAGDGRYCVIRDWRERRRCDPSARRFSQKSLRRSQIRASVAPGMLWLHNSRGQDRGAKPYRSLEPI